MTRTLAMSTSLSFLLSLTFPACGPAKSSAGSAPPTEAPDFAAQAKRGEALYGQHCARCHGASGEGGRGPALVGESALPQAPAGGERDVEFRTAADVYQWMKAHMPPGAPGSLGDPAYLEILAFDLQANKIDPGPAPITADSAATVTLHP
ncbi:c-type cytochrome [Nannocystis punicea]|uniref:Cytochrome c n=1 Tax=Nannocystis punicea TaxID=2995304 RepID=A0ABY7H0P0_9BACT|nr:cytochrome c [Nannocystis poenicansa]WAS92589.1 cytochrome c [Nannocystis poenicansa]